MKHLQNTQLYFILKNKYGKETGDKLIKTMEVQTRNYKTNDIFKATTDYKDSAEYSLKCLH